MGWWGWLEVVRGVLRNQEALKGEMAFSKVKIFPHPVITPQQLRAVYIRLSSALCWGLTAYEVQLGHQARG